MSFADCIDTAVTTGKVKPEKAKIAKTIFQEEYDEALAEGLSDRAAGDRAAMRAVEYTQTFAYEQRWAKINEIRVAADIHNRFKDAVRPDRELIAFGDELDVAIERNKRMASRMFAENVEKFRPKLAGLRQTSAGSDDIVRAAFGEATRDPFSKTLYEEAAKVMDWLKNRANMEGANIRDNSKHKLPQFQDRTKLRQRAREIGRDAAKREWLDEHLEGLDWDTMQYQGRPIPAAKREEILGKTYDSIYTQGADRLKPGHRGSEALATRMSRERFLYYKDSDTWIKMQTKYGSGDVFQQMVSSIELLARDAALLEKMGPNPVAMAGYLHNTVRKRAGELDLAAEKPGFRSNADRAAKEWETFGQRYDIITHAVANGSENRFVRGLNTTRTLVMSTVLNAAFIPNLGDVGFGNHMLLANKLPAARYTKEVVKTFALMPSKERRAQSIRATGIADSAMSMALAGQRYLGPMQGSYWAQKASDVMFRMTWMTPWTEASRWALNRHVQGVLADFSGKTFDELPFRQSMLDAGISEADWNIFRATPIATEQGATFLRPFDVLDRADLDPVDRQHLADRFTDWITELERIGVPSVNSRTLAVLGQGVDADTMRGQVLRMFGAVKSFPVLIMMEHHRLMMARPTVGGKLAYAAQFTVMLTMMGAMITQLRELANGRDPLDMATGEFWLRALLNGGSLGFAGDAILGRGNPMDSPVVNFWLDARNLTTGNLVELATGKDTKFAKEAADFGAKYFPVPWQMETALRRGVLEELQKQADPASYRRMKQRERRRAKELRQRSWWPEGSTEPRRAPDFGAVAGGSDR